MSADLTAALAELARDTARRPLLVALDFDGTLAPLVDDPETSQMLSAAATALVDLVAAPGVDLALISGRSVIDLHRRAAAPVGTVMIGSHGGERGLVGTYGLERSDIALEQKQEELLIRVGAALAAVARGRDGVWVQHKPAAAVLHTRLATAAVAQAATEQSLALAESLGATALHGKDVVEIAVVSATKGSALAALRDELGAAVVLYAGDDTTDEHAFAVLGEGDLTIKVGDGPTVARLRSADPAAFCDELAGFARALV